MKVFTILALLFAVVTASPIAKEKKYFHLQTTGAKNKELNNLFVHSYHTGAGLNDVVLAKDSDSAARVFLNGTNAQVDFKTEFPWGFVAVGDTNYASWESIKINVGYGSDGFSIKDGNFQWSTEYSFGGWLVCDWFHNVPQLFYLNRYYKPVIPSSCSKVQLKPVYLQQK
ncbi:hypothetical protein NUU61_002355 [Penicillium alfredii]|uniref:DUF7907 domain-containing protein n=1 Tax=Penicillium alfredii TaxID=1506179 RepID=A0A9W9FRF5_9EURO|nr:uncharacterized protein NUU61_002355 [Penicillium alfredii]KAJ5105008.1 hypothetical protein NUU61_002355 [Penicillium alfredii]